MNLTTFCGLLAALAATTALAQTQPKKQPVRKAATASRLKRDKWEFTEKAFRQGIYEDFTYDSGQSEPAPPDTNRVYTYVEQMPTLHGQGGFAALAAAIQQQLVLPLAAPTGRAFVQFVVTKAGVVTRPRIVKGLRADVDSAVVVATRQLPRFKPGRQDGRVVAVSYTLAILVGGPAVAKPAKVRGK